MPTAISAEGSWRPELAKSAVFRLCALLALRGDAGMEILSLGTAALWQPEKFATEEAFRAFMNSSLSLNDRCVDDLLAQAEAP